MSVRRRKDQDDNGEDDQFMHQTKTCDWVQSYTLTIPNSTDQ